jgi:hypothetical protein
MVLGDDDSLAIGAGDDLDEDAAWCAVAVGRGEGMVVEGVLDGGEDGEVLVAGVGVRGGGIDTNADIGGVERESEEEQERGEG